MRIKPSAWGAELYQARAMSVSCSHYFFEILSWVEFNIATQTLCGLVFNLLGAGILGGLGDEDLTASPEAKTEVSVATPVARGVAEAVAGVEKGP